MTLPKSPRRTKPYAQLRSKPLEQGKPRKPMRVRGASTRAKQVAVWHRELKQYLMGHLGIEQCESCGTSYALSIMHATKRRFIVTKEDYFRAAIVCLKEHQSYDEATGENPHERMAEFVDALIAKRTI